LGLAIFEAELTLCICKLQRDFICVHPGNIVRCRAILWFSKPLVLPYRLTSLIKGAHRLGRWIYSISPAGEVSICSG